MRPALEGTAGSAAVALDASPPKPRLRGILHLAAVPFALLGTIELGLQAQRTAAARLPALVFGLTLVGLYTTSSLYHVPRWSQRARAVLSRCDGAMIVLTIAATFTPVAYYALSGSWRMWSLVAAWSVAAAGAFVAASPIELPRWTGTAGYMAIGWLTTVPMVKIVSALPWEGTGLIVLGGLLYTTGALVFAKRWPDPFPRWFGYHEIFHVFVVAASAAHYLAIWQYVLPLQGPA